MYDIIIIIYVILHYYYYYYYYYHRVTIRLPPNAERWIWLEVEHFQVFMGTGLWHDWGRLAGVSLYVQHHIRTLSVHPR